MHQEMLCRKEIVMTPSQLAPLKCHYSTMNSTFLKIGPFKLEQASDNPPINIFHNVISDAEIKVIQKLAQQRVYNFVYFYINAYPKI